MYSFNVGTLAAVASIAVVILAKPCQIDDISSIYDAFCPMSGIKFQSPPELCRDACLQLGWCFAFSYNATDGTCTMTSQPCPEALPAPEMDNYMFVLLSQKSPAQCAEWVEFNEPADGRMINVKWRTYFYFRVARLEKNDVTYLGYENIDKGDCYASTPESSAVSTLGGFTCERLRMANDCTAFWVPYNAGDTLPTRAVAGGTMTNGDVMYVAKFHDGQRWLVGYYTVESQKAHSTFGVAYPTSATMELLIIL